MLRTTPAKGDASSVGAAAGTASVPWLLMAASGGQALRSKYFYYLKNYQ